MKDCMLVISFAWSVALGCAVSGSVPVNRTMWTLMYVMEAGDESGGSELKTLR